MTQDTNNMCCMMRDVTIYLYKHSITPVLADISQQSIQSCTPLFNKQFAPGFIAI